MYDEYEPILVGFNNKAKLAVHHVNKVNPKYVNVIPLNIIHDTERDLMNYFALPPASKKHNFFTFQLPDYTSRVQTLLEPSIENLPSIREDTTPDAVIYTEQVIATLAEKIVASLD